MRTARGKRAAQPAYRVTVDTIFLAERRQVVHRFFAKFVGRQPFLCCIELRDAITL